MIGSKSNYDLLKKDGKSYITLKQNSYDFTIGDAHYNLTNLFRGSKQLCKYKLNLTILLENYNNNKACIFI